MVSVCRERYVRQKILSQGVVSCYAKGPTKYEYVCTSSVVGGQNRCHVVSLLCALLKRDGRCLNLTKGEQRAGSDPENENGCKQRRREIPTSSVLP